MKFLLFDIDGTLLDSGGAGTRAMDLAFEELFAVRDGFRSVKMAGRTDSRIVREGLRLHGIDDSNGVIPEFWRTYIKHLRENIHSGRGHIKRGVRETLEVLAAKDEYILGLLTGNIEEGARIKLEAFGLGHYFEVGAFGSDDEDRNRLLPVAVGKLYSSRSVRVGFGDCVVIGDTPRDVECSKPYGALSVAVATGPYSPGSLAEAGADVVFEDLSDTERFLAVLGQDGK